MQLHLDIFLDSVSLTFPWLVSVFVEIITAAIDLEFMCSENGQNCFRSIRPLHFKSEIIFFCSRNCYDLAGLDEVVFLEPVGKNYLGIVSGTEVNKVQVSIAFGIEIKGNRFADIVHLLFRP